MYTMDLPKAIAEGNVVHLEDATYNLYKGAESSSKFLEPSMDQRIPRQILEQWVATTKILSRLDKEAMYCLSRLESPVQLKIRLKCMLARTPCVSDHSSYQKSVEEVDRILPFSSKAAEMPVSEFVPAHLTGQVSSPLFYDGYRHKHSQKPSTQKLKVHARDGRAPRTSNLTLALPKNPS